METTKKTFKSNSRYTKIPTCILNIKYFIKMYNILDEINNEAKNFIESNLQRVPDQSYEEFIKFRDEYLSNYKIEIQIFGANGEFILTDTPTIFNESRLPDRITKIIFDNSTLFKEKTGLGPQYKLKLEFDFNKPAIFDFVTSPSKETYNKSYIQIYGNKQTWVEGAHEKIMSTLRERKIKRIWLHQKNIYDVILLFLIIPLVFWNLYKIEQVFSIYFSNLSSILKVGLYFYLFLTFIFIFRILFNYSRWLFPYLELKTSLKNNSLIQRMFLYGVFTYIAYQYISKILITAVKYIF